VLAQLNKIEIKQKQNAEKPPKRFTVVSAFVVLVFYFKCATAEIKTLFYFSFISVVPLP